MSAPVIEATRLTRRYGNVVALQDATVSIHSGDSVAILGPNGAGKSTLLRLIATLLRPTSGELRLFGEKVSGGGARARRRLGFLSHQSFLYGDLTVSENLLFYARMFGVVRETERVRDVLHLVGLLGFMHRPVRTLSRGLEQRCALARALVHAPEVLLLDEPFSGLDVEACASLCDILRQERRRGTTLLMVTHDLSRAEDLCERSLILLQGTVRYDDVLRPPFESIYHRMTHRLPVAV